MRSASISLKESRGTVMPMRCRKHLQLHDLSVKEYITDKYALWLDFRMTDENVLHRIGRVIGRLGGGIILQIKKKAGKAGELKVYIYLIMDAHLNIQNIALLATIRRPCHYGCCGIRHSWLLYLLIQGRRHHQGDSCSLIQGTRPDSSSIFRDP